LALESIEAIAQSHKGSLATPWGEREAPREAIAQGKQQQYLCLDFQPKLIFVYCLYFYKNKT
jgi:hypothetical protein